MMLQTRGATIIINDKILVMKGKASEVEIAFTELFKFIPKEIRVEDVKNHMIRRLYGE